MRKPLNASAPADLVEQVDKVVEASRGRYANRSHFVQQAIILLLDKEKDSPNK